MTLSRFGRAFEFVALPIVTKVRHGGLTKLMSKDVVPICRNVLRNFDLRSGWGDHPDFMLVADGFRGRRNAVGIIANHQVQFQADRLSPRYQLGREQAVVMIGRRRES
jgi:hypothetical protein